jgi:hypothetical protein
MFMIMMLLMIAMFELVEVVSKAKIGAKNRRCPCLAVIMAGKRRAAFPP